MILSNGDNVLVAHRRLYESDHGRYFLGRVDGYEAGVAAVTGHSWVPDTFTGDYVRHEDERTKIVSLSSGTLFVYRLPRELDVRAMRFQRDGAHVSLVAPGFRMDLTESTPHDQRPNDGRTIGR